MVLFIHMTGPKANEFSLDHPLLQNTRSQEDCGGITYYPVYSGKSLGAPPGGALSGKVPTRLISKIKTNPLKAL